MRWAAVRGEAAPPSPQRELIGFHRVTLTPGESTVVQFNVTAAKLSSVDQRGTRHVLAGTHELQLSRGHGEEMAVPLELTMQDATSRLVISSLSGLFGVTDSMI